MNAATILAQLPQNLMHVTSDSRRVRKGSLFVAYPGELTDGRDFIDSAILNGASAVLYEARGWNDHAIGVPNVSVEGLRKRYSEIAEQFFGNPSRALKVIGVTGTNGKTSTSTWIAQALSVLGKRCGVIGTLGAGVDGALVELGNTTPDAAVVSKQIKTFLNDGCSYVCMEVSSHALVQDRVRGVHFDAAVFTNLTRDHLDYHHTMDAYGEAKAKLFAFPSVKHAIVNADDPAHVTLTKNASTKPLRYGLHDADVRARDVQTSLNGVAMTIDSPIGTFAIEAPVIGDFNVANLLAVISVLIAYECSVEEVVRAVRTLQPVRGRMQRVSASKSGRPAVVVDYAHTPDALEKALATLNSIKGSGRLHVVFGCGGNRDAGKRPIMGGIAATNADRVWITSDNPRFESPESIIDAIYLSIPAAQKQHVQTEIFREMAIRRCIECAAANDIVLIAGKGHETYQEVAGVRQPFDDVEHARAALC